MEPAAQTANVVGERDEALAADDEQQHRRGRHHRGRLDAAPFQNDLPEVLTGTQLGDGRTVAHDIGASVLDQEEPEHMVALVDEDVTGPNADLVGDGRDAAQCQWRAPSEQRLTGKPRALLTFSRGVRPGRGG